MGADWVLAAPSAVHVRIKEPPQSRHVPAPRGVRGAMGRLQTQRGSPELNCAGTLISDVQPQDCGEWNACCL